MNKPSPLLVLAFSVLFFAKGIIHLPTVSMPVFMLSRPQVTVSMVFQLFSHWTVLF